MMLINDTPVFIGTAGYNYDDWKGTFAPEKTLNFDLLTHYINSGLNFLELTYTFYRMPIAEKIAGIAERSGDKLNFSIRLFKALLRKHPEESDIKAFKEGLKPLIDNGKLSAIFADFHHLFGASRENFDVILSLRDTFHEVPFFVELTNSTWHKGRFYDEFKSHDIGLCIVDGPQVKGFVPYFPICTNNNLYFRLYGRSPLWLNVSDRVLDYSYSASELKKIVADAKSNSVMAKNIFFSFCNVEKGNAPIDAVKLKELLK